MQAYTRLCAVMLIAPANCNVLSMIRKTTTIESCHSEIHIDPIHAVETEQSLKRMGVIVVHVYYCMYLLGYDRVNDVLKTHVLWEA